MIMQKKLVLLTHCLIAIFMAVNNVVAIMYVGFAKMLQLFQMQMEINVFVAIHLRKSTQMENVSRAILLDAIHVKLEILKLVLNVLILLLLSIIMETVNVLLTLI